jgi:hypothetical protein
MRCRLAAWTVCSLLLTCALSACGGGSSSAADNGVAAKSANEIVTAALAAIDGAKSAHIAGSVVSGGSPISLNLDLVSGKGGRGQMSQGGLGFQIEVVNHEVYINGSSTFWRHFGGAAAVTLLNGKWLKAPATGQFASLAQLSNLHQLVHTLLKTHGVLAKSGKSKVDGQSAVGVRDTNKDATLYVATTGKAYPLEVLKTGSQSGRLTLSRFNESVTLTPPSNAIDISQFK